MSLQFTDRFKNIRINNNLLFKLYSNTSVIRKCRWDNLSSFLMRLSPKVTVVTQNLWGGDGGVGKIPQKFPGTSIFNIRIGLVY